MILRPLAVVPTLLLRSSLLSTRSLSTRSLSSSSTMDDDVDDIKREFSALGGGRVTLDVDRSGHVGRITISNPEKRNAVSGKMMCDLSDISVELEKEERRDLKGLIFVADMTGQTGEPGRRIFCAGGDILGAGTKLPLTPESGRRMSVLMHDTVVRLRSLPLVSVCLVNGRALGGGAELTLIADFRLFTESGQMAFVQANMGVACGWGGAKRLVDIVGRNRAALRMLLTCQRMDCRVASEVGLCDAVVEEEADDKGLLAAETWLKELIGRHDPQVVHAAKRMCQNAAANNDLREALANESLYFSALWGGDANKRALSSHLRH